MLQMSRTDGGRGPATDPPLTAEREVEGPFSVFPTQAEAGWWDKGRLPQKGEGPCHKKIEKSASRKPQVQKGPSSPRKCLKPCTHSLPTERPGLESFDLSE